MTLSPQWLDELRARTTLSAVIAPSVKLIKAGREYKACCPFHNEKTPSFYVNDEKGFYHCFGCSAHGDAIRFLTEHRGLPFMDAVKELAGKAGMEVPAPDPRQREQQERSTGLHDVMAAAQSWFAERLNGIEGGEARVYLAERGVDAKTIERFGIGFAPNARDKLKAALKAMGEDKLVESGMLIRPEEPKKESYDRFRGRIMFPVRDQRGRVIAFGGRILGQGEPKYLNSPDTPLFDKGRTLYNIDRAGPACRQAKRLIVVEGYMDVIALDRVGIAEVVAPNGTALTEFQLERLWRLEASPLICFDGDAAGKKAAARAAIKALPRLSPQSTLRFVFLPDGQDPDDFIRAKGVKAFEKLLKHAQSFHEFLWQLELEREPLDTPEARASLRKRLRDLASSIQDADVRTQYLGLFNGLISEMYDNFRASRKFEASSANFRRRVVAPEALAIAHHGITQAVEVRIILQGLRLFPDLIGDLAEDIASLWLQNRGHAQLREAMLRAALTHHPLERETLETTFREEGLAQQLKGLSRSPDLPYSFLKRDVETARAERDLAAVIEKVVQVASFEAALKDAQRRYVEALELDEDTSKLLETLTQIKLAKEASAVRFADFWAADRENESVTETA
jgi:DNA primase